MATDLLEDGSVRLAIRKKLNNAIGTVMINEITADITAGPATAIPVIAPAGDQLFSGDKITLINTLTGDRYELTLSAPFKSGETAISINSYTFADNVPDGSPIFFKMTDLLSRLYQLV